MRWRVCLSQYGSIADVHVIMRADTIVLPREGEVLRFRHSNPLALGRAGSWLAHTLYCMRIPLVGPSIHEIQDCLDICILSLAGLQLVKQRGYYFQG